MSQRIQTLESLTINKDMNDLPAKFDHLQLDKVFKKLLSDVEGLRKDILA